jgi:two-component system NtrC family response regulator
VQLHAPQGMPPAAEDMAALPTLRELEREHIARALRHCRWDYDSVARALGIGRTTLWRKIKEYDIEKTDPV